MNWSNPDLYLAAFALFLVVVIVIGEIIRLKQRREERLEIETPELGDGFPGLDDLDDFTIHDPQRKRLDLMSQFDGPGHEDGPWAPGWAERSGEKA